MLRRHLDVFFQYLRPFIAAIVVIPLGLGAAGLALDHGDVVRTQIWAIRPAFLLNPNADPAALDTSLTIGSAAAASALVNELVATDSFLDRVLAKAEPGYARLSEPLRSAERSLVRRNIDVRTEGPQLFAVTLRTTEPSRGIALVTSLIAGVGETVASLDLQVASATSGATSAELAAAKDAMSQAEAALNRYQGQDPAGLQQDPAFQTVTAEANAATGRYLSLVAQAQQAELARSAVPHLEQAAFQVIDPPTAQPRPLDLKSLAVRGFLLGLAGTVAVTLMLVYVIGRRDPRIRSGEELPARTGIPFLGTTPLVRNAG
jgi:hypothetical protein